MIATSDGQSSWHNNSSTMVTLQVPPTFKLRTCLWVWAIESDLEPVNTVLFSVCGSASWRRQLHILLLMNMMTINYSYLMSMVTHKNSAMMFFHEQKRQWGNQAGMRLLFNLLNVYTKLENVYTRYSWTNKMQVVLSHDNSIIINNGQQPPDNGVRSSQYHLILHQVTKILRYAFISAPNFVTAAKFVNNIVQVNK